jgi:hypothetical protein
MIFDFDNIGNTYLRYVGDGFYSPINADDCIVLYADVKSMLQVQQQMDERHLYKARREIFDSVEDIIYVEIGDNVWARTVDRLDEFRVQHLQNAVELRYYQLYEHAKMALEDAKSYTLRDHPKKKTFKNDTGSTRKNIPRRVQFKA